MTHQRKLESEMNIQNDRRSSIRVPLSAKVQIRPIAIGKEEPYLDVDPINLSDSGLCIATLDSLSNIKRYDINLFLDNEDPIHFKARMHWSGTLGKRIMYGICFEYLTPDQHDAILTYLSKTSSRNLESGVDRRKINRRILMSTTIENDLEHRQIERRSSSRLSEQKGLKERFLTKSIKQLLHRRVVITGLGVISPLGNNKHDFLFSLQKGVSGIRPLNRFHGHNFSCMFGGQVKNFNPTDFFSARRANQMDLSTQMILASAVQALKDAKINPDKENRRRMGVATGTVVGGIGWAFNEHMIYEKGGVKEMHPYTIAAASPNASSGEIASEFRIQGPCVTFSQGCTSSSMAISYGFDQIRSGHADIILAAGCETPFIPSLYAAFCRTGVLAHTNESDNYAPKPFAKHRGGIILAEGSATLVLEDLSHALARNATIYAEVVGTGQTCDGYDMLQVKTDGTEASVAMRMAIAQSELVNSDIDTVFSHAPGSKDADLAEMKALRKVFSVDLKKIAIANLKSMMGYIQGATGAIDCLAASLSIEHGFVPPVVNVENTEIPLNVSGMMRSMPIRTVLVNCFGFGGKNVCLVLKQFNE